MPGATPTLYDVLPGFSGDDELATSLKTLGDWIERVESVLRAGEVAEYGIVCAKGRAYSIRVNGNEHEAPHVHVRMGSDEVRLFLGSDPTAIAPDNDSRPGYNRIIRNRATRNLIEAFVRAHHSCLLKAWEEQGNPRHGPTLNVEVICEQHLRPPADLRNLPAPGLNVHLEDAYQALHPE